MRGPVLTAVGIAAGLGVGGMAARRVLGRPDQFYARGDQPGVTLEAGDRRLHLPITYHRTEQVISVHPAACEPVLATLPAGVLHPVRLPDGRALLAISAARYLEGTAPETDPRELLYGEVMVAVLVTRQPTRALVPLVRAMLPWRAAPTSGAFLLHVAMSDRASRDGGRALGFPAFVGDLAFEDDILERRVSLSDERGAILQSRVASRGRISLDRTPMTTYSVRDGELLEVVCPCSGAVQQCLGPGAGRLDLGDHPVADAIRALEPASEALLSRSYLNLRMRITPPRTVASVSASMGYSGGDRPQGAYTVRYPDGSVVDMSA